MTHGHDGRSSKLGEGLQRTAWLDAASYDFTRCLTRRGWAWELLRRNKDYAVDWKLLQNEVTMPAEKSRIAAFWLGLGASRMQRWGLIFRRCT